MRKKDREEIPKTCTMYKNENACQVCFQNIDCKECSWNIINYTGGHLGTERKL
jgi:hypothetical protein